MPTLASLKTANFSAIGVPPKSILRCVAVAQCKHVACQFLSCGFIRRLVWDTSTNCHKRIEISLSDDKVTTIGAPFRKSMSKAKNTHFGRPSTEYRYGGWSKVLYKKRPSRVYFPFGSLAILSLPMALGSSPPLKLCGGASRGLG